MTAGFDGFRPAAFRFLRDLERNNNTAWFEANRGDDERELREPMRRRRSSTSVKRSAISPQSFTARAFIEPGVVSSPCLVDRALGYQPAKAR
jgi:uncharacterized protein (DUF2461 family)